jgi:LemA protein
MPTYKFERGKLKINTANIMLYPTIIIATIILIIILLYNSLIDKKNQVEKAFFSIDVLLKKRCDLIPNLVAVVKNYAQFEQQTLIEITNLRSRLVSGRATGGTRVDLENQISRAIENILVSVEAYPDLQANLNFIQLQESLNEIEEQISAARRFYNTAVTEYNNAVEMFPSNLIAAAMNYRHRRLFVTSQQDRQNVDVRGLFNQ